jgi:hypothetical protein
MMSSQYLKSPTHYTVFYRASQPNNFVAASESAKLYINSGAAQTGLCEFVVVRSIGKSGNINVR